MTLAFCDPRGISSSCCRERRKLVYPACFIENPLDDRSHQGKTCTSVSSHSVHITIPPFSTHTRQYLTPMTENQSTKTFTSEKANYRTSTEKRQLYATRYGNTGERGVRRNSDLIAPNKSRDEETLPHAQETTFPAGQNTRSEKASTKATPVLLYPCVHPSCERGNPDGN